MTGNGITGQKPKRGFAATKAKYENEIAELRAQLEAVRGGQPAVEAEYTTPDTPVVTIDATAPVVDPLAWITEDTPSVFIVSSTSAFYLRPDDNRANPPMRAVVIEETSDPQPWNSNPFDYRNEDRVMEQNNKVLTSKWHHLRIKPEVAEEYWEREKKGPWTETVIDPKKFRGWNKLRRKPDGEKDPITEFVPLRELTRFLLQKNTATYLNWDYHKTDFDPRFPNPYNNRLPGVGSVIKREIDAMAGKVLDSRRAGR